DDAVRHVRRIVDELHLELLVREQRREVLELATVACLLGIHLVDGVDAKQRRVLLVARRRTARALQVVALAQTELTRLLHRHVHVVLRWQEALQAEEAVALVAQIEIALDLDGLTRERLFRLARPVAIAVAVASTAPAPAVARLAVVTLLTR